MEIQSPIKDSFSAPNDGTSNNREWDTAYHVSSFSVGQSIQGTIGTYRDNIPKFIVYIQLILSFIKKFIQKWVQRSWVHMPDDLPDVDMTVTGACSNIECMINLHPRIFKLQHACGYQVAF